MRNGTTDTSDYRGLLSLPTYPAVFDEIPQLLGPTKYELFEKWMIADSLIPDNKDFKATFEAEDKLLSE